MVKLILVWGSLVLAIVLPYVFIWIKYKKQIRELDKEFKKEGDRINKLEEKLLNKKW